VGVGVWPKKTGVLVDVLVGVNVAVGVTVAVRVGVRVGVAVAVAVAVFVGAYATETPLVVRYTEADATVRLSLRGANLQAPHAGRPLDGQISSGAEPKTCTGAQVVPPSFD
jgi:hypothetical protein